MKVALIVIAVIVGIALLAFLLWAVVLPQLGMAAQAAAWGAYKRGVEGEMDEKIQPAWKRLLWPWGLLVLLLAAVVIGAVWFGEATERDHGPVPAWRNDK